MDQREGIKNYLSNLIIRHCGSDEVFRRESTFINKVRQRRTGRAGWGRRRRHRRCRDRTGERAFGSTLVHGDHAVLRNGAQLQGCIRMQCTAPAPRRRPPAPPPSSSLLTQLNIILVSILKVSGGGGRGGDGRGGEGACAMFRHGHMHAHGQIACYGPSGGGKPAPHGFQLGVRV